MGESKHDGLAVPGRVILAREPAFRLGGLSVEPATRQVTSGSNRKTLEPRVMQVLVALARARGEVVTRDELVDRCWEGRIVGDDAVQRAIGLLRQLRTVTGDPFIIETIPRVGYRLLEDEAGAAPGSSKQRMDPQSTFRRRDIMIAGTAVLGTAAIGGAALTLSRQHRPPPLAQKHYERGIAARGQGNPAQYEQAVFHFREATRLDPDYSDAWGALAWAYRSLIAEGGGADTRQLSTFARSAAQRAFDLDTDNADALAALLLLRPVFGRWTEVEAGLRKLLARHPRHSISRFCLGFTLMETGRWREAIPHIQEVARREPMWPVAGFGLFEALRSAGRLEEAETQLNAVTQASPRNLGLWMTKAHHLLLTGRQSEALAFVDDRTLTPTADARAIELERQIVRTYVNGPSQDRARLVARLLEPNRAEIPGFALWAAVNIAMFGRLEDAFTPLYGFYFGQGPWAAAKTTWPITHSIFNLESEALRRDRRFSSLLRNVGLESYWRETGSQPDFRRFG